MEFSGKFEGKSAFFKVTSVMGHVFAVDFPGQFNNWNTVDPGALFTASIQKNEANPKVEFIMDSLESNIWQNIYLWKPKERTS